MLIIYLERVHLQSTLDLSSYSTLTAQNTDQHENAALTG